MWAISEYCTYLVCIVTLYICLWRQYSAVRSILSGSPLFYYLKPEIRLNYIQKVQFLPRNKRTSTLAVSEFVAVYSENCGRTAAGGS